MNKSLLSRENGMHRLHRSSMSWSRVIVLLAVGGLIAFRTCKVFHYMVFSCARIDSFGDFTREQHSNLRAILSLNKSPYKTFKAKEKSFHGKVAVYDKHLYDGLPIESRKSFCAPCGKHCHSFVRALRTAGWRKVNSPDEARLVFQLIPHHPIGNAAHISPNASDEVPRRALHVKTWQRYVNHLPSFGMILKLDNPEWLVELYSSAFDSTNDNYYLPESYRLPYQEEEFNFLFHNLTNDFILHRQPWVRIQVGPREARKAHSAIPNNGVVLEQPITNPSVKLSLLTSHQAASFTAKAKKANSTKGEAMTSIMQKYICHPLTYYGRKLDIRVYWAILSLDPLVVMFHDGYVMTSRQLYNESSFSRKNKANNLMNYGHFLGHHQGKISMQQVREHWEVTVHDEEGPNTISKHDELGEGDEPSLSFFDHVRNQMKEAVAQLVHAAVLLPDDDKMQNFAESPTTTDGFALLAADFTVDRYGNIWLMKVIHNDASEDKRTTYDDPMHMNPKSDMIMMSISEETYAQLELAHELNYGMAEMLEEVWNAQEASGQKTASNTIKFPLQSGMKTGWELVYLRGAHDRSKSKPDPPIYQYKYDEYDRPNALSILQDEPCAKRIKSNRKKSRKRTDQSTNATTMSSWSNQTSETDSMLDSASEDG